MDHLLRQMQVPDSASPTARPSSLLRVLTFNVQHAAPDRARQQAAWIGRQPDADLVILTEVGFGPGGDALLTALAQHGYPHIYAPQPAAPGYRAAIASRHVPLEPSPTHVDFLPHRAPTVDLSINGKRLRIVGLYVPSRGPKERRNQDKRDFQISVTEALPRLTKGFEGPVVVTGDLNVVEPGHVPHYPVFGRWEYDFYRSFAEAGLTDAYRFLHPTTPGHSWFGRSGNGYRFDHTFLTADRLTLSACDYIHTPRVNRLTDHAALYLSAHFACTGAPQER